MRNYRGKRLNTGEWITGFLVDAKHIGNWVEADPVQCETVGECTGIMGDFIHGEPKPGDNILRSFIYEGDIVEPVMTDGTHKGFSWGKRVVVFYQGAFCLKDRRGIITPMCNYSANVKFMVRGNIHDNPELLEVTE